jgi:hypothetical protein
MLVGHASRLSYIRLLLLIRSTETVDLPISFNSMLREGAFCILYKRLYDRKGGLHEEYMV